MKRKRRSGIITTLALICAIIMIILLPLPVAKAANFTISKSNVRIENGKSSTITIKAPTYIGKVDIVSSNSNVATVSESNLWVENNSKTITISAKSVGTATITIKGELYDESTGEEKEHIRTINVNVTKAGNLNNTDTVKNNSENSTSIGQAIEENNEKEIINETENLIQEVANEEISEGLEENVIEEETKQIEESKFQNSKGKIIIIAVIGVIAFIMIFLGIGISKNIFKK